MAAITRWVAPDRADGALLRVADRTGAPVGATVLSLSS